MKLSYFSFTVHTSTSRNEGCTLIQLDQTLISAPIKLLRSTSSVSGKEQTLQIFRYLFTIPQILKDIKDVDISKRFWNYNE